MEGVLRRTTAGQGDPARGHMILIWVSRIYLHTFPKTILLIVMRRRRDTADHRSQAQELDALREGKQGRENNGICAGPDRRLYCAPRGASTVLVVDRKTDKLSFIRRPKDGQAKLH